MFRSESLGILGVSTMDCDGGDPIVGEISTVYSVLVVWGDNGPLPSVWLHLEAAIFFGNFTTPEFLP